MLKVGDKVPPFALTSDAGTQVSLASLGSGPVIIYFYPRDDTPGCTREAQAFTGAAKDLKKLGAQVYGVSKDTTASHCKFRDKYKLNFPLLSDPDLAVHKAFGAYGEKNMYGKKVQGTIRSTFVVQNGRVTHVFSNVKVDGHIDAVLERVASAKGSSPKPPMPAKSSPSLTKAKRDAKSAATVKKKTASKVVTTEKKKTKALSRPSKR